MMFVVVFFFFKQKTAYEMRISDWSSDVCPSDLESHPDVTAVVARVLVVRVDDVGDLARQRQDARVARLVVAELREAGVALVEADGHAVGHGELGGVAGGRLVLGGQRLPQAVHQPFRSEEHTSELQSLMRISYAVFCLTKKNDNTH